MSRHKRNAFCYKVGSTFVNILSVLPLNPIMNMIRIPSTSALRIGSSKWMRRESGPWKQRCNLRFVFLSLTQCTLNVVQNDIVLTQWTSVLLEKLTVNQLLKNVPAFYGTRNCISMLATSHSWSPS
jgi:hypothetical protein